MLREEIKTLKKSRKKSLIYLAISIPLTIALTYAVGKGVFFPEAWLSSIPVEAASSLIGVATGIATTLSLAIVGAEVYNVIKINKKIEEKDQERDDIMKNKYDTEKEYINEMEKEFITDDFNQIKEDVDNQRKEEIDKIKKEEFMKKVTEYSVEHMGINGTMEKLDSSLEEDTTKRK